MNRALLAAVLASLSTVVTAAMPAPVVTANYFPLVDGAKFDYTFVRGPHATATAVMHSGRQWAGATGLTGVHMSQVCRDAMPITASAWTPRSGWA